MSTLSQYTTKLVSSLKSLLSNRTCTKAQALANASSKPNTVYYTSDTHEVVLGGVAYGKDNAVGSAFAYAPDTSSVSTWDTDKIYIVPTSVSGVYTVYVHESTGWESPGTQSLSMVARYVTYDPTTSGIAASEVQTAIDKLKSEIERLRWLVEQNGSELIEYHKYMKVVAGNSGTYLNLLSPTSGNAPLSSFSPSTLKIVVDGYMTNVTANTSRSALFCTDNGNGYYVRRRFGAMPKTTKFEYRNGASLDTSHSSATPSDLTYPTAPCDFTLEMDVDGTTTFNGQTSTAQGTTSTQAQSNIRLFNWSNNNGGMNTYATADIWRVSRVRLYDTSGTMIADYRPATDSNGNAAMYEKVNGAWYHAKAGAVECIDAI